MVKHKVIEFFASKTCNGKLKNYKNMETNILGLIATALFIIPTSFY